MLVPILALFKLLGVNTRSEALQLIVGDLDAEESRLLCGILDNDTTCDMSYDDLMDWLGRDGTKEPTRERHMRYLEHIITNEMLPHMGLIMDPVINRAKACYLGRARARGGESAVRRSNRGGQAPICEAEGR